MRDKIYKLLLLILAILPFVGGIEVARFLSLLDGEKPGLYTTIAGLMIGFFFGIIVVLAWITKQLEFSRWIDNKHRDNAEMQKDIMEMIFWAVLMVIPYPFNLAPITMFVLNVSTLLEVSSRYTEKMLILNTLPLFVSQIVVPRTMPLSYLDKDPFNFPSTPHNRGFMYPILTGYVDAYQGDEEQILLALKFGVQLWRDTNDQYFTQENPHYTLSESESVPPAIKASAAHLAKRRGWDKTYVDHILNGYRITRGYATPVSE